jgi:hypothetical protein
VGTGEGELECGVVNDVAGAESADAGVEGGVAPATDLTVSKKPLSAKKVSKKPM